MDEPHMTPDQIKEAALKTALKVFLDSFEKGFPDTDTMRTAIDVYEAAMWRPIEEAPRDGTEVIVDHPLGGVSASVFIGREWRIFDGPDGTTGYIDPPTHFRPLPQPPEVKP